MRTIEVDAQADSEKRDSKSEEELLENWVLGVRVPHNYKISHDKKKMATWSESGVEVIKRGEKDKKKVKATIYQYELVWDPTSRYIAFVTQVEGGSALRIVDTQGDTLTVKDIHTVQSPDNIGGIEWSPRGPEIYWVNVVHNGNKGVTYQILRKSAKGSGGKAIKIVETRDVIDFFMPPVTWFESGQGPTTRPYGIVYGTQKGLFVVSRSNPKKVQTLTQAPAMGVTNLEWSDDGNKILLYFDRVFTSRKHGTLRGVMLAHLRGIPAKDENGKPILDKNGRPTKMFMEPLYKGKKIHTLWFSPGGKYITWAKETGCWYRKPEDDHTPGIKIPNPVIEDEEGKEVVVTDKPIKGCVWNEDSTRLAITAGNQIWVYDATTKKTELYREFGEALSHFVAEPVWNGNRLILTVFEDINITGREPPRPKGQKAEDLKKRAERAKKVAKKADFLKAQRERARRKAEEQRRKVMEEAAAAKKALEKKNKKKKKSGK